MVEPGQGTSLKRTVPVAVDAALGAAALAMGAAASVTRHVARAATPVWRVVMHPPLLNERLHPGRVIEALADRGEEARTATDGDLNRIVAAVVPPVVYEVLDSLDLTTLVIERVDMPVRLEKRLAALLTDLATQKRMSLSSLFEETFLHTLDDQQQNEYREAMLEYWATFRTDAGTSEPADYLLVFG